MTTRTIDHGVAGRIVKGCQCARCVDDHHVWVGRSIAFLRTFEAMEGLERVKAARDLIATCRVAGLGLTSLARIVEVHPNTLDHIARGVTRNDVADITVARLAATAESVSGIRHSFDRVHPDHFWTAVDALEGLGLSRRVIARRILGQTHGALRVKHDMVEKWRVDRLNRALELALEEGVERLTCVRCGFTFEAHAFVSRCPS